MLLGIDEVGRGPWAGPLVVGAVILGKAFPEGLDLTDSKKLTPRKREALEPLILENAVAHGLGWVSAAELDRYGLSASLKLATRRAVKTVLAQLSTSPEGSSPSSNDKITRSSSKIDEIIIDGTINFLKGTPLESLVETLPKADALVREVSAASIIAKVARDRYMAEIAQQYPVYGFEKHVGYGTDLHQKALREHGICPEHRQSFRPIREIIEQFEVKSLQTPLECPKNAAIPKAPSPSQKGQTAELAVASYLQTQNHQILAHNFKTKAYEIDLISTKNREIFFTEVKYSKNPRLEGTPLVRITSQKQAQMRFAAACFLQTHSQYEDFSPILAVSAVSGENFSVDTWFTLD